MNDPNDWGGWEAQRDFYRDVWRRATPAERMQKLEELLDLARQSGALQRAVDRKLEESRRLWEA
jgi:hypothetical protein